MKKSIFLLLTFIVLILLFGCDTDNNGEAGESSVKNEESTTYSYYEGIYPNKDWLDLNNGDETLEPPSENDAVPDKEAAIVLACETFERLQQEGIGQSYVLKSVFYDTEYDVWIVCFGEEILIPGSCYYIAISKATGEIIKEWPGE